MSDSPTDSGSEQVSPAAEAAGSAPAEETSSAPQAATPAPAAGTAPAASQPAAPKPEPAFDPESSSYPQVVEALKQVIDPELMINIVDLGLIYEVELDGEAVNVDMTLTSPACPAGPQIMQQAKMALEQLETVAEAKIRLVMSPPWSPERMTDDARDQLGIF